MVRGRLIRRSDAAGLFYDENKLNRFYSGKTPSSLSLLDVHSRLELYTKSGKRRRVQGKSVY